VGSDFKEKLARHQVIKTSEAESAGVSRMTLRRMVGRGELMPIHRGYYARTVRTEDGIVVDASDHRAKIAAFAEPVMVDRVICLETAACMHHLTNRPLGTLYIGVHKDVRVFRKQDADQPLHIVVMRWSDARLLDVSVEQIEMFGRLVYVTSPARTVVDLLRYAEAGRGDVSLAREVLQRAVDSGVAEGEITEIAEKLGVQDVVRQYVLGAWRQER
jgi:predicted transcriptional regulator of viral defense system